MATAIAPAERPDPLSGNLKGFLLLFVVLQCLFLPIYIYSLCQEASFAPGTLSSTPYEITYNRLEMLIDAAMVVAVAIGLFLIIVRDPRTRGWWIAVGAISIVLSVAHIWLVRALPHRHLESASDILARHGFFGSAVWLAYWSLSSRVKIAFGPHYAQPPVSYSTLGAVTAVLMLLVLLVIGAASLA